MKKFFAIIFLLGIFISGCGESAENISEVEEVNEMKIKIQIGDKIFNATLKDNPSTRELLKNFPPEIMMTELNGNEKYYRFNKNFPSADKKITAIHSGDLMLWSSNTLVLFYKNFSTNYSYTRLGKIENHEGLEKILGKGNVKVIFVK